ncbi:MAG TPA: SdiA-regulated domain-containing protein, partial [Melioribacteraceae bacterium]|nr:SdiA-regulated domain-containing protein [Melioribacteraceae bacterium]
MKKELLYLLIVTLLFTNCKRNEPDGNIVTPTDPNALNIIQEISLPQEITEPSGIFYNSSTNTLFIVSDNSPKIFEVNINGILKSTINTSGVDLEGITFSSNNDTIWVVEESGQKVSKYLKTGLHLLSFPLNVATNSKHALEGITIDNQNHLFVINEKEPTLLVECVNNQSVYQKNIAYASDISDICYDNQQNCLWVLSDESSSIVKIDKKGNLIATYKLPMDKC